MSDEVSTDASTQSAEINTRAAASMGDTLGDMASTAIAIKTSIPPSLQRSALKAIGRLVTVSLEYPTTLIENAIGERKAESEARRSLINTQKEQLAAQLSVSPAFIDAASIKFAQRIVREQVNVDSTVKQAVEELSKLPPPAEISPGEESPPVGDDWLTAWEAEVAKLSEAHAQLVFAKILAGEINRPKTFSKKTLRLLGQLDNRAAEVFARASSLSVVVWDGIRPLDVRVPSLGGQIGQNFLKPFGLSYADCVLLQEYDLVVPDIEGQMDYQAAILWENMLGATLRHAGAQWILTPKIPGPRAELKVDGLLFSASGSELVSIVQAPPNDEFTERLKLHLDQRGMIMTRGTQGSDGAWSFPAA